MNFVRVVINLFQFNRTNWKAVILCLLAAAIFWLFNAFNKSQSSTIRFPLRFDYDYQRYVAVKPLPHQININVTGSGWELIRKTLGMKLPELVIPVERPLETKKIPSGSITPLLASQLGNLTINYISIDTLRLLLEERTRRTFRLAVDLNKVRFKEGYGITGAVDIVPDSVVIDGPRSIVRSIPDTISVPLLAAGISKSFRDEVEVPLFNSEAVQRNPPVVSIRVEVGEVETLEVMVKVNVVRKPRTQKALADSVKALIQIPVKQHNDFQDQLPGIQAMIDWNNVEKKNTKIYPTVIGLPVYARVIAIDTLSYKID
jgi:YbbR domain-containing protein